MLGTIYCCADRHHPDLGPTPTAVQRMSKTGPRESVGEASVSLLRASTRTERVVARMKAYDQVPSGLPSRSRGFAPLLCALASVALAAFELGATNAAPGMSWRPATLESGLTICIPSGAALVPSHQFEWSWLAVTLRGETHPLVDIYMGRNWDMRSMTYHIRVGKLAGLEDRESPYPYHRSILVYPPHFPGEIVFNYSGLNNAQRAVAMRIIESLRADAQHTGHC